MLINDTNNYLLLNGKRFCYIELPDLYETFISNREIICCIKGKEDTPFSDGVFKILIKFPDDYPYNPPKFKFITPIYHPNLYSPDYITIYTQEDWSASSTIASTLIWIYTLMCNPFLDLVCEIDSDNYILSRSSIMYEYRNSNTKWKMTANNWTQKYALPQIWSIFNHKCIVSDDHRYTVIYMLWVGNYIADKLCYLQYQGFIDIWITYIMPHIINPVGDIEHKKRHYDYIPNRVNYLYF